MQSFKETDFQSLQPTAADIQKSLNIRDFNKTTLMSSNFQFLPTLDILSPKQGISKNSILSTSKIEEVCQQSQKDLNYLKLEMRTLTKENEELKELNKQLVDKLDKLQTVIDKEATANTYFFNYPPKRDPSLAFEDDRRKAKAQRVKDNSDTARLREMYDQMMEVMKRNYEAELSATKRSMGLQIESL